mmetsp:Transcript_30033/g.79254  ORF Transcript_30033/g.79254 Transcript_30033/m.79254 type:complete len:303 (-) Transcript_30033:109-1017(-)
MRAICAVARDSSTLCKPPNSADPRATSIGWYGEEHCVSIRVVGPSLRWNGTYLPSAPSTAGGAGMFPALRGYVGCSVKIPIGAEEYSVGLDDATSLPAPSPYYPVLTLLGGFTTGGYDALATGPGLAAAAVAGLQDLPAGLNLTLSQEARNGSKLARGMVGLDVVRGMEGRILVVCVGADARATSGGVESVVAAMAACVEIEIQRCMYCVGTGDTLGAVMSRLVGDSNWLRLWAVNGNDDGRQDTILITHPDQIGQSSAGEGDFVGQEVMYLGRVYRAKVARDGRRRPLNVQGGGRKEGLRD